MTLGALVPWANRVTREDDAIKVEVSEYDPMTFDRLAELSETFGTKDINVGSETRSYGYCETCRGYETLTIATVLNATKHTEVSE